MNIHEYQAKALLRQYGAPVSDGRVVIKADEAKTAAKDRVKLRYLLKRIAREEKIEATDAEVTALLNAHAMRSGAKSAKEWLQKAKLKETEVRKGLRADLLTTKTIDALMGHAKLTGAGAGETK